MILYEIKELQSEVIAVDNEVGFLDKNIVVEKFPELKEEILDDFLLIDEVYDLNKVKTVYEYAKPYLEVYNVFPIMNVFGDTTVCMGYSSRNRGEIYYHDFDFGIFELTNSIDELVNHLSTEGYQ